MRRLGLSMALLVLLAACGGGGNTTDVRDNNGVLPGDNTEPGESVPDDSGVDPSWLPVEARADGDGFTWHLSGADGPVSVDDVSAALGSYAAEVDVDSGMPGPNADGISANPVYFSCPAGSTSRAFCALLELMVSKSLWRVYVELKAPGGVAKREWVELPMDQGLGAPLPLEAHLRVSRDGETVRYRIGPSPSQQEAIQDADYKRDALEGGDFEEAQYKKTRDALKTKIASIESPEGEKLEQLEITPASDAAAETPEYVSWAAMFVVIDAAARVNETRKGKPLEVTFRFMDALGNYRDD